VPKHVHEVVTMDVVPYLLAFVTENDVIPGLLWRTSSGRTKNPLVERRNIGSGQATSPETDCLHSKVTSIFLNHNVSSNLGSAENAVFAAVNAHAFINAMFIIGMRAVDFPARRHLHERQAIRRIT